MKTTHVAAVILLAGLAFIAGCGVPEAEISGAVTIDGQPLNDGDIIFEEADNSVAPAVGKVVAGVYKTKSLPGSKIVRINASRPSAIVDPHMGVATRESMIAEEFNVQSTLKAEIKPGKNEGVDFKVKSIPPK
jgi:hypothetical protein